MTRQEFEDALKTELSHRGQPIGPNEVEDFVETNWPSIKDVLDVGYWADQYQLIAPRRRV
jgi:hypothetical protein